MTQRQNYEAIIAWANGEPIQQNTPLGWVTVPTTSQPDFVTPGNEFRPTPETFERKVLLQAEGQPQDAIYDGTAYNAVITFDSATGNPIGFTPSVTPPNS